MRFGNTNSDILLIYLLVIGIPLLISTYLSRHKKEKIEPILIYSIITFLIIYFPLLEYWSIWVSWSFWPSNFYPFGQLVLLDDSIEEFPISTFFYNLLTIASTILLIFNSFLFIFIMNFKIKKYKILNWIPFINIFFFSKYLLKAFQKKLNKVVVLFWVIFTALWVYYKLFAPYLFFLGWDTITPVGNILFPPPNSLNDDSYSMGHTYIFDILNIILPVLIFISGLLTLFIVQNLRKNTLNLKSR